MTPSGMTDTPPQSYSQSARAALPALLRSRIGLAALAGAVVVAGLAFNWSWLVAAGIAPLLISLAPCAAMCALGLCMTQKKGGDAAAGLAADPSSTTVLGPPPSDRNDLPEALVSGDGATKAG